MSLNQNQNNHHCQSEKVKNKKRHRELKEKTNQIAKWRPASALNLIGSESGAGILNQSHNVVEHIYEEIPDCSRNSIEKLLSILVVFDLGKIDGFFFYCNNCFWPITYQSLLSSCYRIHCKTDERILCHIIINNCYILSC